MDIKYVIFDLDDTLLDTFNRVKLAYQAAYDYLAAEHSLEPVQLWENGKEFVHLARKMGSINPGETMYALLLQWGIPTEATGGNIEKVEKVFGETMKGIRPFDGVSAVIEELVERGVGLGIISDGPSERQWYKIDSLPFRDSFRDSFGDNVWVSGDFPPYSEKPNQAMFRAAIDRFGVSPGEIIYVGDRDKDQIGANLAGMVSVRVLQGYSNIGPYRPEFEVEIPDFVIENITQIVEVIEGDWPRFERGV